ncbi:hypothetical protein [Streptomyces acidiscabies]|uniref:hypothetical protein n=1 Tax=Streptomyces acidiscabies TaxID=42234 RepID=UPI0009516007|nr:hypothetical protein [Streptomyces acidiscabies]
MTDRHTVDSITSDDLDALYTRIEQLEDLLRIANETSNKSEAERARATQRADELAATLHDVLRHFVHPGHPGEPCLQTGWISVSTVTRWRNTLNRPGA